MAGESWRYSYPAATWGYYRGTPFYGGSGSGYGTQGVNDMAGSTSYAAGQGPAAGSSSGWHPSVLYMFVLIFAEMFVFAYIGKHL